MLRIPIPSTDRIADTMRDSAVQKSAAIIVDKSGYHRLPAGFDRIMDHTLAASAAAAQ